MGRVRYFGGRAQGAVRLAGLPADADYVQIGPIPAAGGATGKKYEFDNNAAVTAGAVSVTIGVSAAATATNLMNAINANKPTPGVTAYIDPIDTATVRIAADSRGAAGNLALAKSGANVAISDAALTGGENGGTQTLHRGEYVVTALDVLAGSIMIETGVPTSPRFMQVDCFSATGLQKALTSLCTFDSTRIKVDFDGATNPVAGDKISWAAYE